jgi:protein SCO1/2
MSRLVANLLCLLPACMLMHSPALLWAQLGKDGVPAAEEGIGVESRLGESLDGGLGFHDAANNFIELGSLFDGRRPLILSFNYSNCPKLCSVQLQNLTQALRQVDFTVGKEFQVVSVSIDPNEQSARAAETKDKFTTMYARPGTEDGWHFLTGEDATIRALAAQAGVKYKYLPDQKLFSHPPVLILVSPEGKLVRYLYGLDVKADTLKLALVEAAAGKIGSPVYFLTYITGCYAYNDMSGQYTMQAMSLMRLGGLVTIAGLVIGIVPYLFWRGRSRLPAGDETVTGPDTVHAGRLPGGVT